VLISCTFQHGDNRILLSAEFCKKIAEEPSSNADTASVEKSHEAEAHDEDDNVFSASTLKAVTAASIIMNIRVS